MLPDTFIHELNARCADGRDMYRLRWNNRTETFALEQKVNRATEVPPVGDDFVTSRVREGYGLVIEFAPAPTLRCPDCGSRVALPVMKTAEVRCTTCAEHGQPKQMWFTGYFPLCDKFLTYLERTAPKRGDAWAKEMDDYNRKVAQLSRRAFRNHAQAVAGDYWKQVAQIQQIGYGRGPASFGR